MNTVVKPGASVGPFKLGAGLYDVLGWLRAAISLKHNELLFNQNDALSGDLVLVVKELGMRLRFDAPSQRLKLIDIFDMTRIALTYAQNTFSGAVTPTFRAIYKVFGATYPGTFHPSKPLYLLQYPGICFFFPVSPEAKQKAKGSPDWGMTDLGESAVASRVVVHSGATVTSVGHATVPPPLRDSDLYFEPVQLYIKKGIYLTKRRKLITFDHYTQDVLTELGAPSQVFIKQMDQMKIHTKSSALIASDGSGPQLRFDEAEPETAFNDYLLNYFGLGFDICFDGGTHRVKKFILHTNAIGSADFNQYRKCNFQIFIDSTMQKLKTVKGTKPAGSMTALASPSSAGSGNPTVAVTGSSVSAFLSSLTGATTHFASLSPTYAAQAAAPSSGGGGGTATAFGWNTTPAPSSSAATGAATNSKSDSKSDAKPTPAPAPAPTVQAAIPLPQSAVPSGHGGKRKHKGKSPTITPAQPPVAAPPAIDIKTAAPAPSLTARPTAQPPPSAISIASPNANANPASASASGANAISVPIAPAPPKQPSAAPTVTPASAAPVTAPPSSGSGSSVVPLLPQSLATPINCDTKWEVVQSVFASHGLHTGRPMLHNTSKKENPFGSTLFYAYDSVVFEVLRDGHLKAVTLFSEF